MSAHDGHVFSACVQGMPGREAHGGPQELIAAMFSHTLATANFNYFGAEVTDSLCAKLDVQWQTYLGLQTLRPMSGPRSQLSVSLFGVGEDEGEALGALAQKVYGSPELRPSQRAALVPFMRGESVAVFAGLGSGKSCNFLFAALAAAKRSQFVLVLSPLRIVSLNTTRACEEAGISCVLWGEDTRAYITSAIRDVDDKVGSQVPFSILIASLDALATRADLGSALNHAVSKNKIARVVYDEA